MFRSVTPTTTTPVVDDAAIRITAGRAAQYGRSSGNGDGSAAAAEAALAAGQRDGGAGDGAVDTATLCRLLSLLADKTRLRILWLLADGERAVGHMTSQLALPQPTVSHHLAWLRTMHLVSPRRAGKNVFYALGKAARTEGDGSLSLLTGDAVVTIARRSAE